MTKTTAEKGSNLADKLLYIARSAYRMRNVATAENVAELSTAVSRRCNRTNRPQLLIT